VYYSWYEHDGGGYILLEIMRPNTQSVYSPRSAGWSWRLELEWCERKTLLPDWWPEAGAGVV